MLVLGSNFKDTVMVVIFFVSTSISLHWKSDLNAIDLKWDFMTIWDTFLVALSIGHVFKNNHLFSLATYHLSGRMAGSLSSGNMCHFLQSSHWTQVSAVLGHHSALTFTDSALWLDSWVWSLQGELVCSFWGVPDLTMFLDNSGSIAVTALNSDWSVISEAPISLMFAWKPVLTSRK